MKRRRRILYLILMLIFILAMWFLLDEKKSRFSSPDECVEVIVRADAGGLIYLEIFDKNSKQKEIKFTPASIYQRYRLIFLENDIFLFKSSDTGSALFKRNEGKWYGMNVYSFINPANEFVVVLLSKAEEARAIGNIDKGGEDLKDSRFSTADEYKLLVFDVNKKKKLFVNKWYRFSADYPPYKAIKWSGANEFVLKDESQSTIFIINDNITLKKRSDINFKSKI